MRADVERVLSNWIKESASIASGAGNSEDQARWIARRFLAWWQDEIASAISHVESPAVRAKELLEQQGGWNNPALEEILSAVLHVSERLGDLRSTLGLDIPVDEN